MKRVSVLATSLSRVLLCAVVLTGLLLPLSAQTTTNTIASVNGPIGVAITPNEILVSSTVGAWPPSSGNPVVIYSVDTNGNKTLFATMPDPAGNPVSFMEDYMAISPGLGCFPAGNVYVNQGNQIYVIPPNGGTPTLFATLTNAPPSQTGAGLTFDTTGLFGNALIATTQNGFVYTIDCHGGVKQIAATGAWLEQPQVAPPTFGNYAGYIFVGGEKEGLIYVIGPNGVATTLQDNLFDAEVVRYIPPSSCTVGASGDQLIATIFDQNAVVGVSPTVLQPYANSIVVFGEFGGSDVITTTKSGGLQIAPATLSLSQIEDIAVLNCAPQRVGTGFMTGGGSVFTSAGVRVTHGFELHCDASKTPNNLEINWPGNIFHMENLTSAFCFMDPRFSPTPPVAPFNTYVGTGTGRLNNVAGATARWTFTDAGEPGKKDRAEIVITDSQGNTVLTVDGLLNSGNQQAHK